MRAMLFAGDSPGSLPHLFRRDLATGTETQLLPAGPQQLVMDVLPGGSAVAYTRTTADWWLQVLPTAADGRCIAHAAAATEVQLVWACACRPMAARSPSADPKGATSTSHRFL